MWWTDILVAMHSDYLWSLNFFRYHSISPNTVYLIVHKI